MYQTISNRFSFNINMLDKFDFIIKTKTYNIYLIFQYF